MQVILIKDAENLGGVNKLITVSTRLVPNFLIPLKYAIEANGTHKKALEDRQKQPKKK
jgi:ribosomal protein L9